MQYLDDSIEVGEAAQVLILHVAQAAVLGRHQLVLCQLLQDALLHLWMLTDQVPKYNIYKYLCTCCIHVCQMRKPI